MCVIFDEIMYWPTAFDKWQTKINELSKWPRILEIDFFNSSVAIWVKSNAIVICTSFSLYNPKSNMLLILSSVKSFTLVSYSEQVFILTKASLCKKPVCYM